LVGGCFDGCASLTNVTFSSTITTIEKWVFYDCIGLTNIIIPSNVDKIGEDAFAGCTNLTNITFLGKTRQEVLYIKDNEGNEKYPWGISDISIINVA